MESPFSLPEARVSGPVADEGAGPARVTAPPAVPLDAPPSNRASNSCIGDPSFLLLRKEIDSLELSYRGVIEEGFFGKLERLKELAQSKYIARQAEAQIELGAGLFAVGDKGMGRFPFVLTDSRFLIKLGRGGANALPVALVQIRSEFLAHVGTVQAEAQVCDLLGRLAEIDGDGKVSRIDLAVDFSSAVDMEGWGRNAWVTRAPRKDSHAVGERFTGWSIGLSSAVSARLYDKNFEIETVSKKYYLRELWERAGWCPIDQVWRLEFQVRRPVLGLFGMTTLGDVLALRDELWQYLTGGWLRLTIPNPNDDTRSRWANHPMWVSLNAVRWDRSGDALTARRAVSGIPSDTWLAQHATSVLAAQMAKVGTTDIEEGWLGLRQTVERHWAERELWEGTSAEELIRERVRAKGRKYGTMSNVVAGTAGADGSYDMPAGNPYRRASRGGDK